MNFLPHLKYFVHPPLTLFSPLLTVSAHPSTHARSKMGPVLTPTVPQASSPLDLELGTQFVARSLLSFPRSTLPRPAYKMKPQSRFWPPGSEIPSCLPSPRFPLASRQSYPPGAYPWSLRAHSSWSYGRAASGFSHLASRQRSRHDHVMNYYMLRGGKIRSHELGFRSRFRTEK